MAILVPARMFAPANQKLIIRDRTYYVAGRVFSRQQLVECCFTSTETVGVLGTRAQDGHLDLHTAPDLCQTADSMAA